MTNLENLKKIANTIRINALKAIYNAKSGHPGGSLSIAEILSVLYFNNILKYNPENPDWADRDRLIISKGHASPAIYACLGLAGYFNSQDFINNFRKLNSKFQGHIDKERVEGIEFSTGSLGQGLSVATGLALGFKLDNKKNHVFAIISDGELQEGQSWEAIMSASHYKLNNLTVILDSNKIQLCGRIQDIMSLEPLEEKFKSFGFHTETVNGHDISELSQTLEKFKSEKFKQINNKPSILIANTIKGKGVSFMENTASWHGKAPNEQELNLALKELENI